MADRSEHRSPSAPTGPPAGDDRLEALLRTLAADAGYDLEALTVVAAGRRRIIRVIIDRDAGVSLDDAADLSRAISERLEAIVESGEADPTGPSPYTLEVTSPGVGRPLTAPRHFRRARTRLLSVHRTDGTHLEGRVAGADDHVVHLLVGASGLDELALPFAEIATATVQVEFNPPSAAVADKLGLVNTLPAEERSEA